MNMFQFIILVIVIISSCTASQGDEYGLSRKHPFKHPHHLHHGIIHYWAFLAIKAKIIFLIGTFISFWVFAGKAFAFLYYVSRKDKCDCHDSKIIYDSHFDHKYAAPSADYFQKKIFLNTPNFQQKYSTIRNPTPNYRGTSSFARSIENSIFGNMDFFKKMINKADLTEIAFEIMHLNEKSCKMRFVCEADQSAENNSMLAFSMHLFSDMDFMKYRTNVTDCKALGPHCLYF